MQDIFRIDTLSTKLLLKTEKHGRRITKPEILDYESIETVSGNKSKQSESNNFIPSEMRKRMKTIANDIRSDSSSEALNAWKETTLNQNDDIPCPQQNVNQTKEIRFKNGELNVSSIILL